MRRDSPFELRVLTGTHAGARTLLSAEPQLLGSSDDCDLILSDEGILAQHARLEHQEDGSTVLRWLDSEMDALVIRPGQGAELGSVQIVIEPADAPWRTDPDMLWVDAPGDEPTLDLQGDMLDGADAPMPHDAASQSPPAAQRRRVRRILAATAAGALLAVLAWWGAQRPGTPVDAPAASASAAAADAPAASLEVPGSPATPPVTAAAPAAAEPLVSQALAAVLARLDLGDRVGVQARSGRTPLVQATLLSDEETERLAIALSRLQPRPGLRVVTLADLQAQVDAALQEALTFAAGPSDGAAPSATALAAGQSPATAPPAGGSPVVQAVHLGEGRFRVQGRVPDEATRDRILASVRTRATDLRGMEAALLTDAEAAATLLADLREQGVGQVEGEWLAGVLSLAVTLTPQDVPAWERALAAATRRTPLRLRATVQITQPPPLVLPFKIRSVISSDTPLIVLDDGARLGVGSMRMRWRVADIQPDTVVFEDPSGRRMVFQR